MITAGDFYKWLKIFNVMMGSGGVITFKGTWNASTNTPTLTSSVGTSGDLYIVSVAGNTNLNGITDWQPGDWAVFNGTIWQKVDNTQGNYVVGPASANDSAIALFDGITGKLIKNSSVLLSALQLHSAILDSLAAQTPVAGNITLDGNFNGSLGALIASDASINLTTSTGGFLTITGTTEISEIILAPGYSREVIFADSLNLVNGQIILPTGSNIITRPGDMATIIGGSGGGVYVTKYQRLDGSALTTGATVSDDVTVSYTLDFSVSTNYILTIGGELSQELVFTPFLAGIADSMLITLVSGTIDDVTITYSGVVHVDNFLPVINQGVGAITVLRADWNGSQVLLSQVGDANAVTPAGTDSNFYLGSDSLNSGSAVNIDFNAKNSQTVILNSPTPVLTLIDGPLGNSLYGYMEGKQDGTGGSLPSFVGNFVYDAGVAPKFATGANEITALSFVWNGAYWRIFEAAEDAAVPLYSVEEAGGISLPNTDNTVLCSLSLPAGDYRATARTLLQGDTVVKGLTYELLTFFSTDPGNNQTGLDALKNATSSTVGLEDQAPLTLNISDYYFTLAAPATIYLKAFISASSGSITGYGRMDIQKITTAYM